MAEQQRQDAITKLELSSILETTRLLVESSDISFVTNNLLLVAMGKLMVTKAMIILYESDKHSHVVYTYKGKVDCERGKKIVLDAENEIFLDEVIELDRVDISVEDCELKDQFTHLFNLKSGNEHIGFLCLGKKFGGKRLTKDESEFIKGLAAIAAISISNARLIDKLRNANRALDRKIYELNTLFDLSKQFNVLASSKDIANILKFTLLGHLFIKRMVIFYKSDAETKDVDCLASNGIDVNIDQEELLKLFKFEDDIADVKSISADEYPFLAENYLQYVIGLRFQSDKLMLICVGNKANGTPFTDTELYFISSMGNLALLSIQKTFLLKDKIEKERIEEELNLAKSIQKGLLPTEMPTNYGLEISGLNISSNEVGGDYYDILEAEDQKLCLAIADVTGKGIPASLLMANLQALIHTLVHYKSELDEASARINDTIYKNTPPDKFITFFWGIYDAKDSLFNYVNAGHNPPYLYQKSTNSIKTLEEGGIILGAMPTFSPYEQSTVKLESGDVMVMFTDGVTEAFSPDHEEYGEERLEKLIATLVDKSAEEIQNAIVEDIMRFADGVQYDDITLLVVKKN